MGLPVVNYTRIQRIQAAETPPLTGWEMTKSTKICVAVMFAGCLCLYKRWRDKTDRTLRKNLDI